MTPPELAFTVATKKELPLPFFKNQNTPIITLKAIQSGTKLPNTHSQFILITGVGPENSQNAAKWLKTQPSIKFVVNIGSAGNSNPTLLYHWIQSLATQAPNEAPIPIHDVLPFPFTPTLPFTKIDTIKSSPQPVITPPTTTNTAYDMEAHAQAKIFDNSNISFHCLKFITDTCSQNSLNTYTQSLEKMTADLETAFTYLKEDPLKISVIIPTYNRAHTLKPCIESVLKQTHPTHEIIIVDDASTDTTPSLLKHYQSNYPDLIKIITLPKNKGVSTARNTGIKEATGNWIALLDSDDEWTPEKLQNQAHFIQTHPHYEILQSQEKWIRNGQHLNQKKHHQKQSGFIWNACLDRCMISPSSVLFKKSLFTTFGPFNPNYPACEDYDLWLKISRQKIIGLENTISLIKTGGHTDQLSTSIPLLDHYRLLSLKEALKTESNPRYSQLLKTKIEKKCQILITGAKKRNLPIHKDWQP